MKPNFRKIILCFTMVCGILYATGQSLISFTTSDEGMVEVFKIGNEEITPGNRVPLVSFILDSVHYDLGAAQKQDSSWDLEDLEVTLLEPVEKSDGSGILKFQNKGKDTLKLGNVVLFGSSEERYHITGYGDHWLSRTRLFRPGQTSVPVILPDNAWELGYSDVPVSSKGGVYGLARRSSWENATRRRFETHLNPGGSVNYKIWVETYTGDWREGLRKAFQERYLYDLDDFDDTLFQREDLKWIRSKYIIHLMMAWDHFYYDRDAMEVNLQPFIERGRKWYGGDDAIGLWPTWPTLGLDQRNQWDYFRDLPGGIDGLSRQVKELHDQDIRFFICYNPWDESTRLEDHLEGMRNMIAATDADGVVLDTRGSSSVEIQQAADEAKAGVVMYSEGMAVPKDMPYIVSGRVHNALYYPPMLNLNKFIRPDFAIFRVAELAYERIRREYNLCLFNGYGVEINMFKPGQPEWVEADYKYLGRVARILRENHPNFIVKDFVPLIDSEIDSVYINYWPSAQKDIYTLYSLRPEGVDDTVFKLRSPLDDQHIVDLWNHEEINTNDRDVRIKIDAFHKSDLGTNNEGAVSVIGVFRNLLSVNLTRDSLAISSSEGDSIQIWKGLPQYEEQPITLQAGIHNLNIRRTFGRYEGKLVIQLFEGDDLLDERVVLLKPGEPRLISKAQRTESYKRPPGNMIKIEGGHYKWKTTHSADFIGYPYQDTSKIHAVSGFYMDKNLVTNEEFKLFIDQSGYQPIDRHNFLAHWNQGEIPVGIKDHPVVYVSYQDAAAYAKWAGKRLPTEMEWQYAAQAGQELNWPWGMDYDSAKIRNATYREVGTYPSNPLGISDLVGHIWQLTNDVYSSGSYTYSMIKGGSYFDPTSSWWYVKGGPQPFTYRQQLLMVSPGFDRKGTVGFRCVADR